MSQQTACPKCGQYKLRSSKIPALSVGIFLALCGAWLSLIASIWGILGTTAIIFFTLAAVFIFIGSVQKGQTCQHCNYRLFPAK